MANNKKNNKKILLINTGGTISMNATKNGFAPDLKKFKKTIENMPELKDEQMPCFDIYNFDPLLDSSNVSVNEWNLIGEVIEKNYKDYDGFVILHGTDTMAYTASALSFMLENLKKPVVITGSQIPLYVLRSDGKENLISSMLVASDGKVPEVCIFFANELLRGNRTIKYSANDFIAFKSPGFPPLANVGIDIKYYDPLILPKTKGRFRVQKFKKVPIGVIKVFPGIQFGLFESVVAKNAKGIVFEAFGAGNIPNNSDTLQKTIKSVQKNGTVTVICSQCPHGTVMLGTYEASGPLKNAGAINGKGMTTEAAVAKLYYLFSKNLSTKEICELMETPLRGEEL